MLIFDQQDQCDLNLVEVGNGHRFSFCAKSGMGMMTLGKELGRLIKKAFERGCWLGLDGRAAQGKRHGVDSPRD